MPLAEVKKEGVLFCGERLLPRPQTLCVGQAWASPLQRAMRQGASRRRPLHSTIPRLGVHLNGTMKMGHTYRNSGIFTEIRKNIRVQQKGSIKCGTSIQ